MKDGRNIKYLGNKLQPKTYGTNTKVAEKQPPQEEADIKSRRLQGN